MWIMLHSKTNPRRETTAEAYAVISSVSMPEICVCRELFYVSGLELFDKSEDTGNCVGTG